MDIAGIELEHAALFLDVDGTLIDYVPCPDEARADAALLRLLESLHEQTQGALALVSGRSIGNLDVVMDPYRFAACGLHGFERRSAHGDYHQNPAPDPAKLAQCRQLMGALVIAHPQLLFEDKRFALALHYRCAPQLEAQVTQTVNAISGLEEAGLRLQHGRLVVEIAPAEVDKGSGIAGLMSTAPFRGRLPIFIGDDLTDEAGFRCVNRAGGVTIAVAPRGTTAARASLSSVTEVRAWLAGLAGSVP
jgi:trehalose 6-phosphate phosphatase